MNLYASLVLHGVVTPSDLRRNVKEYPDFGRQAVKMGVRLLGRPSVFEDDLGNLYKIDFMGAARQHGPFLSRVEVRDASWGDFEELAVSAVKHSPRLPADWKGPMVVVASFEDGCLVATRVGEGREGGF